MRPEIHKMDSLPTPELSGRSSLFPLVPASRGTFSCLLVRIAALGGICQPEIVASVGRFAGKRNHSVWKNDAGQHAVSVNVYDLAQIGWPIQCTALDRSKPGCLAPLMPKAAATIAAEPTIQLVARHRGPHPRSRAAPDHLHRFGPDNDRDAERRCRLLAAFRTMAAIDCLGRVPQFVPAGTALAASGQGQGFRWGFCHRRSCHSPVTETRWTR